MSSPFLRRLIFILACALGPGLFAAEGDAPAPPGAPVVLDPLDVKAAPYGYLGIKHATVALDLLRTLTFRGSVKMFRVDELFPDSPAIAAGIKSGDHIVAMEGEPIDKWSLKRLKKFGESVEVGQHVSLQVISPPDTKPRAAVVVITRKPRKP